MSIKLKPAAICNTGSDLVLNSLCHHGGEAVCVFTFSKACLSVTSTSTSHQGIPAGIMAAPLEDLGCSFLNLKNSKILFHTGICFT